MTALTSTTNNVSPRRGFTFVELMLVVLILALVTGVSGVYYMGTYKQTALNAVARNLMLMGKYARIYAIEKGQPCHIVLGCAPGRFHLSGPVYDPGSQTTQTAIISNPYCRKALLKNGIEFELVQVESVTGQSDEAWGSDRSVTFYPDGSCDAAVIQVGNGRHSLTVIFSSAYAKIKIYEGSADTVEGGMQAIDLDATDV